MWVQDNTQYHYETVTNTNNLFLENNVEKYPIEKFTPTIFHSSDCINYTSVLPAMFMQAWSPEEHCLLTEWMGVVSGIPLQRKVESNTL